MRIFGKDTQELKYWIGVSDPIRDEVQGWEKDEIGPKDVSGYKIAAKLKDLDYRAIKQFGDTFSPEVYDAVRAKFPSLLDDPQQRFEKMVKLERSWHPQSDVLYLRFGQVCLGLLAASSSWFMTAHFRRVLHLNDKARLSMYTGAMYVPAVFAAALNNFHVCQRPLYGHECRLCNGLLSAVYQSTFSVLHPLIFNCLSGLYFAQRYFTIGALPPSYLSSRSGRSIAYKVAKKVMMKERGLIKFSVLFMANFLAGYHVGYMETDQTVDVYFTLLKDEAEKQRKHREERFAKASRGAATVGQVIDPSNVMIDTS